MRFAFPLCFALAACSSDPAAPIDSGLPPGDIATEIAAWIDTGAPTDATDDRMALPDFGPRDTGADVPAVDATEDRPAPMDVADVPPADVAADVPTDDGILRPDRTAPMDDAGRLLCGTSPGQACTTNADCARCTPGIWCCAGDGPGLMECTGSSVACVGP